MRSFDQFLKEKEMLLRPVYIYSIFFVFFSSPLYALSEVTVDCDSGDSIMTAIDSAVGPTQISVFGTCNQSLVINKNDISLLGNGDTVIDGASFAPELDLIVIDGAVRVKVDGFNIQNGEIGLSAINGANITISNTIFNTHSEFAIHASNNASISTSNVNVVGTGSNGINVQAASILSVVDRLSVIGAGTFGLNLQDGSLLKADGADISFSRNLFGTQITIGSTAFVNDSSLAADSNVLAGLSVDSGSTFFAFSSHISASKNFLDGILCNTNSNIDIDASSTVKANNNGRHGINLEDTIFNVFSFFQLPGPVIEANDNAEHGVLLELGSKIDIGINSSLTSMGNGKTGLYADDGSTVKLRDSTIKDNQISMSDDEDDEHQDKNNADVSINFGSRISFDFDNNDIGIARCDRSSISRGAVRCLGRD